MPDGSIVIQTSLDNKTLERELSRLSKRMQTLNNQVYMNQNRKAPLLEQAEQLTVALDAAKASLATLESGGAGADKIAQQRETVKSLQSQWDAVQNEIDKCDRAISRANENLGLTERQIEEVNAELSMAPPSIEKMDKAAKSVARSSSRFASRIKEVIRSALIFTVISQGFAQLRTWMGRVINTSEEARAAIARLKGAFLTLVQPIINVVIPALTTFLNILANIVSLISSIVSRLFGTTAEASAEAAKNLYDQTNAIESVGAAADKAGKSLASFDEINQLSGSSANGGAGGAEASDSIAPDFSIQENWLEDTLGKAAGWVTAALLLGGIALVAIGAAIGSIAMVLAGLTMIGSGVYVGTETGVLQDWAETLGLENASQFVTAALLIAGIALIAIGAAMRNLMAVLAGMTLLGAGVAVGVESGTFQSWAQALGLDSVYDYVTAGMQIAGLVFIALGAAMTNIWMVVAGCALLAVGVSADAIGEETVSKWWEKLQLTNVQQWVSAALMVGGIALVAIGAAIANIAMVLVGMGLIGFSAVVGTQNNNLSDWVETLGLEKATQWVTAGLLVGGIALVIFGIATANMAMVLAGLGLLGAGVTVGITSGTFQTWLDAITTALSGFADTIEDIFDGLWDIVSGVINGIIGGVEWLANAVIRGINTVIRALNNLSFTIPDWIPGLGGKTFGFDINELNEISIPRLAQGAVIPPNREFLAVLGDQTSGTNIEAPLSTIEQAMINALNLVGFSGGQNEAVFEVDGQTFARLVYKYNSSENRRIGVSMSGV